VTAAPTLAARVRAALHRRRPIGSTEHRSPVGDRSPAALLARPLLALPAPPGADRGPICLACGYRHPPVRLASTWSTPIDGSLDGRPRPLRHTAPPPTVRPSPWRYP
jgi:hypothetical protein